ncbi:MAG: ketol-acid reductoisomerase [Tepidisphaeraceae bacterium]
MSSPPILYERDAPLDALSGRTVAVIGYGSQGHAHALNLRDSEVRVIVSNRKDSPNGHRAGVDGFELLSKSDAVQQADLIILATPDEVQPDLYAKHIVPIIAPGKAVGFIHGLNIHYRFIVPGKDIDVIMVAPKGQGDMMRRQFQHGRGVPALVAIHQDATGNARNLALAWARGIGAARAGIIQTTFKDECETDLFGEQAVLCGGLTELIKAGFDVLTNAGYPPEIAYFECVHELKLIVDLIHRNGIAGMRRRISSTARYGSLTRGPRVIGPDVRETMRQVLLEITDGRFAEEWRNGAGAIAPLVSAEENHPVEIVGKSLRNSMPWLAEES